MGRPRIHPESEPKFYKSPSQLRRLMNIDPEKVFKEYFDLVEKMDKVLKELKALKAEGK